ncbi:MAG: hypothetical protein IPK67_12490 [Planctomycetes bacterium]|nr:hypothetical protein [Planctomycetota bacterium]
MKITLALGVLALSLVPALAERPQPSLSTSLGVCENTILREPVLVYEYAGSTLVAQIDRTLYVYGDGSLKLAEAEADSLGRCLRAQTTPREVALLRQALFDAGAMGLCDDARRVMDVPLNTLTLFNGAQDARAHTFSYWIGDGNYEAVDGLIQQFIVDKFP